MHNILVVLPILHNEEILKALQKTYTVFTEGTNIQAHLEFITHGPPHIMSFVDEAKAVPGILDIVSKAEQVR